MKKKILAVSALLALILSTGCANNAVEQSQNSQQPQISAPDVSTVSDTQSSAQATNQTTTIQDTSEKYTVELTLSEGFEIVRSTPRLVCIQMNDNITGVITIMNNLGESVDISRLNNTAEENKATLYSNGIEEVTVNDYTVKYIMYKPSDKIKVDGVIFVNDDIMLSVLVNNTNDDAQETRQYIENLVKCISNIKAE
ncbi:MAG: hypothetical protein ACI4M3_07270 [Acutalibacteraceae bacterium]